MKKCIWLMALLSILYVAPVVAEECDWDISVCFGVEWDYATPADIKEVDVRQKDAAGNSPLHWAAKYSEDAEVIDALIKAGAKVNSRDRNRCIPLHDAARYNYDTEIIDALIKAGARVNAKCDATYYSTRAWVEGITPLHFAAAYSENPEVIGVLIKAGARVNAKDGSGSTPLYYAHEQNNHDATDVLIRAGGKTGIELDK